MYIPEAWVQTRKDVDMPISRFEYWPRIESCVFAYDTIIWTPRSEMARGFAHWTWKPAAELVFARRRRFIVRSPGSSEVEETFVERTRGHSRSPTSRVSTCNAWTLRLGRETNSQSIGVSSSSVQLYRRHPFCKRYICSS